MSIQWTIGSANTNFTNPVLKNLPTIPGLKALYYFGTTGDGINTNRASGGVNGIFVGNTVPIVNTNYVTVSAGANNLPAVYYDTYVGRTANAISNGYTWMVVYSLPASGNPSTMMKDLSPNATTLCGQMSQTKLNFQLLNAGTVATLTIADLTKFNCASITYSGNTNNIFTLTDFGSNTSNTYTANSSQTLLAANSTFIVNTCIGDTTSNNGGNYNTSNIPFALVAHTALSNTVQQQIYSAVKLILARRGVTVV